ncbi:hypothetical protein BT96DRAFT_944858 [Gymnopus androsaceus JB14]|uniref:Uncharacterized protein n=1 Tax=Gymnopus androsaceus JB14 TaxID=1447944 RepID=A0A6A4H381_9AGAR|nr:hypothetical protein BT96DRAFT_944858 [Gymnopus androsaceus JB14]
MLFLSGRNIYLEGLAVNEVAGLEHTVDAEDPDIEAPALKQRSSGEEARQEGTIYYVQILIIFIACLVRGWTGSDAGERKGKTQEVSDFTDLHSRRLDRHVERERWAQTSASVLTTPRPRPLADGYENLWNLTPLGKTQRLMECGAVNAGC